MKTQIKIHYKHGLNPGHQLPIVHQPITFTMADFEGVFPHDDDLIVVYLRSKKYDVERVIIDPESAENIMYYKAFQKLRFESEDLKPFFGTLVDFTNRETT